MKSDKKLLKIFEEAEGIDTFYTFNNFKSDIKSFLKDLKKGNTICSVKVSRSGLTRHFNFDKYNMLFNICYNEKFSWGPVKVVGCGMDTHWHLKFFTCKQVFTKGEIEKYNLNLACSGGKIL